MHKIAQEENPFLVELNPSNKKEDKPQEPLSSIIPKWPAGEDFKSLGEFGSGDESHGGKHDGIDLQYPINKPVYPILPGKVLSAATEPKPGSTKQGNAIKIEHTDFGYSSFYAHLGDIMVSPGQEVDQTSQIATTGLSGNAYSKHTEPHIHLEVKELKSGKTINPRLIIGKPINKTSSHMLPRDKRLIVLAQMLEKSEKSEESDERLWEDED